MGFVFGFLLSVLAIFLILLVLVQRGRGGGLAGALGGMGGSSAFGAKAGDVFTRITIVVVAIWIFICILAGHWARGQRDPLIGAGGIETQTSTELPITPPPAPRESPSTLPPLSEPANSGAGGDATPKAEVETPAKAAAEPPTGDK